MTILHTARHGIAYADTSTALADLADMTAQVATTLDAALDGVNVPPPGSWSTPTTQTVANFPTANGWPPLSYRLEASTVLRIRGGLATATVTAGQVLFTLPAGLRPVKIQVLWGVTSSAALVVLYANPDGTVAFANAGSLANVLLNVTLALN